MSREAATATESRSSERGAERTSSRASEQSASLSRSTWSSMESRGNASSEPKSGSLHFDHESLYGGEKSQQRNVQYAAMSGSTRNDASGTNSASSVTPDSIVDTSTKKTAGGGHVDRADHALGDVDTRTYNKDNKLTKDRTDHLDGGFHEKTIGKNNDVKERDQKGNGDFTETTTTQDGKTTSRSLRTNPDGGKTESSTDENGRTTETTRDKDKHLTGTKVTNKDGSYHERKENADQSITIHDQTKDGSYVETNTTKDGTSRKVHDVVDPKTQESTTKTYDPKGNLTVDRSTRPDGSYTESTKNKDGTTTEHIQQANGDFKELTTNDKGELTSPQLDVNHTASPEFVNKVRDDVNSLPANMKQMLIDHGSHIVATGKILDARPDLKDVPLRGHKPGTTWNDIEGATPGNQVIVAERTDAGPSSRTEGAVKHEVGHQIDRLMNYESSNPDFVAAYNKDTAAMSPEQKTRDKYELQTDKDGNQAAGRSEAFAEVFGALNGSSANKSETQQTLSDFPNTAAYLKKRLGDIH